MILVILVLFNRRFRIVLMKKFNTLAVVLKSINYKDADKIYTLFSYDLGKIPAIARGVRKISSRRAGNLDTLNLVKVHLTEKDNGMRQLDEVAGVNSFRKLKSNYELNMKCTYIVELLHRTTEEGESNRSVFELFVKFLKIASQFPDNIDLVMRYFEFNYLREMGYGIDVYKCLRCGKSFDESSDVCFLDTVRGGFTCGNCTHSGLKFSSLSLKVVRDLLDNKLTQVQKPILIELETMASSMIDEHFDVRIKSRELL